MALLTNTIKFNDSNRQDEVSFREKRLVKLEKGTRRQEKVLREGTSASSNDPRSRLRTYVEATTNDEAPVMLVLDEALATTPATIIIHLPAIKQLGTITAIIVGFVSDARANEGDGRPVAMAFVARSPSND